MRLSLPAKETSQSNRSLWVALTFGAMLVGALVGSVVLAARSSRRSRRSESDLSAPLLGTPVDVAAPTAPIASAPHLKRWIYLFIFVVCTALLLSVPRAEANLLLALMIVGSVGIASGRWGQPDVEVWLKRVRPASQTPSLAWVRQHPKLIEISIILLTLFIATGHIRDWSPELRLDGAELSYLLNSGIVASDMVHRTGSIPLWNPFMGSGEPLIESPFSFILNPLMTIPIYLQGPVNGPKLAMFIHIVMLSLGGWALADRLKLHSPGRLLLALLLVGSGGFTGLIGKGFYQMGLSLAYVPWVFTGLLGALHDRDRRSISLLAVSSTLMIFAGTYWYVLPTAIGAALITLFALIRRDPATQRRGFNLRGLWSLFLATVLLTGLSAVRLLPQIVHDRLLFHPREFFDWQPFPFMGMFEQYFKPVTYTGTMNDQAIFFQFTLPLVFAVYLLVVRLALRRQISLRRSWRVVVPGLILMVFFAVWAQGGTPLIHWLYFQFQLLMQWRFTSRMMAAGALWVAVIAAIWFDEIVVYAWLRCLAAEKRADVRTMAAQTVYGILLAVTLVAGTVSTIDVLHNWRRAVGLFPLYSYDWQPLFYLRAQHPDEFLSVRTPGFFRYEPFYQLLVRASFGNPDYRPLGLPSTIGAEQLWEFPPEYAWGGVGGSDDFAYNPADFGYEPVEGSVEHLGGEILWHNVTAPSYAFIVAPERVTADSEPLDRAAITPVTTFEHRIESIAIHLDRYPPGYLLAIQEVAYPGWRASINGQEIQPESLGGRLAVYLPIQGVPVDVAFWYDPVWLYRGAAITLISSLLFAAYSLRLGRWLRRARRVNPEILADKS
ncbi:MAG: YfhO family protein [Anaerolineae bacterium]|nr:YfhO family protein [Anaerolineae bacterium]